MRTHLLLTLGLSALVLAPLAGCDSSDDDNDDTLFGEAVALGNGTARAYVEQTDGVPTAVGVALSADALIGLPNHYDNPAESMMMLEFPAEARAAGLAYDHVMLGWNPQGHEPEGLFTLPHFDFHFNLVPMTEIMTWMPGNPVFDERGALPPAARYTPQGFIADPSGLVVPMMGMHWLDASDPTYAPGGPAFTEVLLWGSFDEEVVFTEPMITKAFLEGLRTSGSAHEETMVQPQAYAVAGLYPTRYTIRFDTGRNEYRVEMGGLTHRTAG